MESVSVSVLDWIDGFEPSAIADDVWRRFLDFTARYGLQYGIIYDQPADQRVMAGNIVRISYPDDWMDRYLSRDYFDRDPVMRGLLRTRQAFTWTEGLQFEDYPRADQNIVYEAGDFGLRNGLLIPLPRPQDRKAMVALGGERQDLSRGERSELHFAALYTHACMRALGAERYRDELPPLTVRERECLEWAALGKSDWEIGEILAIAAGTAGRHIERAKQKLGVSTRVQAVVTALQRGAISV